MLFTNVAPVWRCCLQLQHKSRRWKVSDLARASLFGCVHASAGMWHVGFMWVVGGAKRLGKFMMTKESDLR